MTTPHRHGMSARSLRDMASARVSASLPLAHRRILPQELQERVQEVETMTLDRAVATNEREWIQYFLSRYDTTASDIMVNALRTAIRYQNEEWLPQLLDMTPYHPVAVDELLLAAATGNKNILFLLITRPNTVSTPVGHSRRITVRDTVLKLTPPQWFDIIREAVMTGHMTIAQWLYDIYKQLKTTDTFAYPSGVNRTWSDVLLMAHVKANRYDDVVVLMSNTDALTAEGIQRSVYEAAHDNFGSILNLLLDVTEDMGPEVAQEALFTAIIGALQGHHAQLLQKLVSVYPHPRGLSSAILQMDTMAGSRLLEDERTLELMHDVIMSAATRYSLGGFLWARPRRRRLDEADDSE